MYEDKQPLDVRVAVLEAEVKALREIVALLANQDDVEHVHEPTQLKNGRWWCPVCHKFIKNP